MSDNGSGPALTPAEWSEGCFQRGSILGIDSGEGTLSLMRTGVDGNTESVRIDADQRHAVAALAANGASWGFSRRDHADEVLAAVLLDCYRRGVPFDELDPELRMAVEGLVDRRGGLADRIAALLPAEESGSAVQGAGSDSQDFGPDVGEAGGGSPTLDQVSAESPST